MKPDCKFSDAIVDDEFSQTHESMSARCISIEKRKCGTFYPFTHSTGSTSSPNIFGKNLDHLILLRKKKKHNGIL